MKRVGEGKSLKVLHVVLSLETGGLENGIVNLINNHSDNVKVDVLCLRAKGALADRIFSDDCSVYWGGECLSAKQAVKEIKRLISKHDYDIVHSHGWTTMLCSFMGALLTKAKVLNGEHGTLFFDSPRRVWAQKALFRLVKGNVTVSAALKNEIVSQLNVPASKFKVVVNGVDTEKFFPDSLLRRQVRSDLRISEGEFVVMTVGRMVQVKNYPFLIEAFQRFLVECPEAKLFFVGDGPEREALSRMVQENNLEEKVVFLGRRSDIPDLMRAADLFMLTSFREGMSNTLLESMSSGTPVVASEVGGANEIVDVGVSGFLFDSGDLDGAVSHMIKLYQNRSMLNELSDKSRNHICEKFSIHTMVKNYEAVYRQL